MTIELRIGKRDNVGSLWTLCDWDPKGACLTDFEEIAAFLMSRGWTRTEFPSPCVSVTMLMSPDRTAKIDIREVAA